MITSRQKLPTLDVGQYPIQEGVSRGGYILIDSSDEKPDIIFLATGSEVSLVLSAREKLQAENIKARVVSMPSLELFDMQPLEYRQKVLPSGIPKLAVEAASPHIWYKYIGERGDIIGLERFGASAPGDVVMKKLGFSIENVIARARKLLV
jgi:transketolase